MPGPGDVLTLPLPMVASHKLSSMLYMYALLIGVMSDSVALDWELCMCRQENMQ